MKEWGRDGCILVILLEEENEGGRVGYFATEVHHSVAQCQAKFSAQSPEKNKGFGWLLDWLINMLQGLHFAIRLLINPTPQTHHLQYSRTASCSRADTSLKGISNMLLCRSWTRFSAIPLLHRVSVCLWSDTIMLLFQKQEKKAF